MSVPSVDSTSASLPRQSRVTAEIAASASRAALISSSASAIGRSRKMRPGAVRHDQRLAQRHLEDRRDHEPEHQRRRIEAEFLQRIADHAEDQHDPHVDDRVVHLVDADHAEHDDQRIEIGVGDPQQVHEHADQRQVEQEQHQVADIHRRDEAPEHVGMVVDQVRPRRHAVDQERRHQHRDHRPGRQPERQHRHERAGRGGVVGGFRAGDAGDRTLAEFFRMPRKLALERIGHEARDDVRRARDDADQESEHRAARDRPSRLRAIPAASANSSRSFGAVTSLLT